MLIGSQLLGFSRGGCVLDTLSSGVPVQAFSQRRLTASYAGKCINVRRSSDNSAVDIGFVGNELDVITLLNFCGSGSGYVTKWYNSGLGGSAGDAFNTTAAFQPRIVNAGVLETLNGRPALNFGGATGGGGILGINNSTTTQPIGSQSSTLNMVYSQTSGSSVAYCTGLNNSTNGRGLVNSGGYPGFYGPSISGASTFLMSPGVAAIVTAIFQTSTSYIFGNGTQVFSQSGIAWNNTPTSGQNKIGQGFGSFNWTGMFQEVIQPLLALSTADRQTLEHNQEAYYGIGGI